MAKKQKKEILADDKEALKAKVKDYNDKLEAFATEARKDGIVIEPSLMGNNYGVKPTVIIRPLSAEEKLKDLQG